MLIFFKKNKFHRIFLLLILIFFSNNIRANIIRDAEIENFLTEMANPIFEAMKKKRSQSLVGGIKVKKINYL